MPSNDVCQAVSKALNDYWVEHKMPPSMRELSDMTKVNSTSIMAAALDELEAGGLIKRGPKGTARSAVPLWVIELIDGRST